MKRRKKLDEPLAKFLFRQVIVGLGYLHKKNIIHRDIKLENILIDNEGIIKIADFGISKEIKPGTFIKERHMCGTPAYMSPEMIREKAPKYDGSTDVWATGVVLFVMVYGHLPFLGD